MDVRIQLNKEQAIKFLSCFIDDARRIANERKQAAQQQSSATEESTAS